MSKKQMGTMVLVKTTGEVIFHHSPTADITKMYELIGCSCVERIRVRYDGKARDCYLDEEGLLKPGTKRNPKVKTLAEEYYGQPCQEFFGNAVIWVPNQVLS